MLKRARHIHKIARTNGHGLLTLGKDFE
jgi:hypothetical protein